MGRWINKLRHFFRKNSDQESSIRETIEELIDDIEAEESINPDEREILGNVLNLRDLTAEDVMTPRADLIACPITAKGPELIDMFIESGFSRLPIYQNSMDNIVGIVMLKDVLKWMSSDKPLNMRALIREAMFVAPSIHTLDLLIKMRLTGTKTAIVVDEFGGVDGLVSINDIIEEIVGDIQEAGDRVAPQKWIQRSDGAIVADARMALAAFQEIAPQLVVSDEAQDEVDTLGGLVVTLAGHVPVRGELIQDGNGTEFEILDADPRRVRRVLIRLPKVESNDNSRAAPSSDNME